MTVSTPGFERIRRSKRGWAANFLQVLLGITQQVALIPIFLHFWTGNVLAAWLAIYAAGNFAMAADAGLQVRCINRFLAFRATADCDGRTGQFYAAMLRIYFVFALVLAALIFAVFLWMPPSAVFGFRDVAGFDTAFAIMVMGILLTLPTNLSSALYRARGRYGRAVQIQNAAMLIGQLAQLMAILTTGHLLAVTIGYVVVQLGLALYLLAVDTPRLFPFLRRAPGRPSLRWIVGQFRRSMPFGIANTTELALVNLPVLLVSAIVSDRIAVAQWGLTRVVAGLLRAFCVQATLPLAAELGHDHAAGLVEPMRRLYARGSVLVTIMAAGVVSGLLAFWPDFFNLWTRGTIPYDPSLAVTLLVGTAAASPAILALGFATYSNRAGLLVRAKTVQLLLFLALSILLIHPLGPLGAAIAVVFSDLLGQFGFLGIVVIRQTLQRPARHLAFLLIAAILVIGTGWGLGAAIRMLSPGAGLPHFLIECVVWLALMAVLASPLLNRAARERLISAIPS